MIDRTATFGLAVLGGLSMLALAISLPIADSRGALRPRISAEAWVAIGGVVTSIVGVVLAPQVPSHVLTAHEISQHPRPTVVVGLWYTLPLFAVAPAALSLARHLDRRVDPMPIATSRARSRSPASSRPPRRRSGRSR